MKQSTAALAIPSVRKISAFLLVGLALSLNQASAATQTWTGASGATWNTGSNWSNATVPAATDTGLFNSGSGTVVLTGAGNTTAAAFVFDTNAGAFTIGSTTGNTIQLRGSNQISGILSSFAGSGITETINAPIGIGTGSFLTNTIGNYNSDSTNTIVLNGGISGTATGGVANLVLGGTNTGNNVVNGLITNGAAGLRVSKGISDTGTWTLANNNNSFTGGVTIGNGSLKVGTIGMSGANSALGTNGTIVFGVSSTGAGVLVYTGTGETTDKIVSLAAGTTGNGTIDQSGTGLLKFTSDVVKTGTGSNSLVLQGSTAGSGEFAGKIENGAGTLGLIKNGTNTWTISNTNGYTGATTVNGGTLNVTGGITSTSALNLNAGTMIVKSFWTGSGTTGNILLGANGDATLVYTGIGQDFDGNVNFRGSGNKTIDASGTGVINFTGSGFNPPVGSGTRTIIFQGTGEGTFNPKITDATSGGATSFIKQGTGTWTLFSNANSFTGGATVLNGTLIAGGTASLGSGALTLTGGTLDLATDTTINAYNPLVNGDFTIVSDRKTAGAGVNHTFGTLSIGGNTLNITAGANVTAGSPIVTFGAVTLNSTATATTTFNPTTAGLNLGSVTGSATSGNTNTLDLNGTNAFAAAGTVGTISDGSGGGRVAVVKNGIGEWALTTVNSYTGGTTVNNGTLYLLASGALGNANNSLTMNGGNLDLQSTSQAVGALSGSGGTILNNGSTASTLTVGNNNANGNYAGIIADNSNAGTGTVAVAKTGSGAQTFSGANTYSGGTQINGGRIYANSASGSATGTGQVVVGTGSPSDATLSGLGTIAPVFNGDAVRITSGATLNPGGVQPAFANGAVANGSLTLNMSGVTGGNALNVESGAKLTFDLGSGGYLDGAENFSGSKLVLTGTGTVAFNDNVITIVDLTSPTQTQGDSQLTFLQEYVLIDGSAGTTYSGLTLGGTDSFGTLITGGLTLSNADAFFAAYPDARLYLNGNNIDILVPEPSTWALMIGSLAILGFYLRRQQRNSTVRI